MYTLDSAILCLHQAPVRLWPASPKRSLNVALALFGASGGNDQQGNCVSNNSSNTVLLETTNTGNVSHNTLFSVKIPCDHLT